MLYSLVIFFRAQNIYMNIQSVAQCMAIRRPQNWFLFCVEITSDFPLSRSHRKKKSHGDFFRKKSWKLNKNHQQQRIFIQHYNNLRWKRLCFWVGGDQLLTFVQLLKAFVTTYSKVTYIHKVQKTIKLWSLLLVYAFHRVFWA